MSDYQDLIFEINDGIALVTLNRPEVMNALNNRIQEELDQVLSAVETDPQIRAMILTGGPKCFCAGADIKASVKSQAVSPIRVYQRFQQSRLIFNKLDNLSKPTIAAMSGPAMGGGCELALACDFRIASESLKIALSEVRIGMIPAGGGTQRLPRLVGISKAKEMILLGKILNAQEALQIGLVDKVVPVDELISEANKLASAFIDLPPLTLKMAKAAINRGIEMPLNDALEYEAQCATLLITTEDRLEGMKAFVEKRKPVFRGL
ncbi:MAG: enoyl-CoA hydratase/isomerase family protein [Syntrophomonadaceae bacterium]|jgi:enoyl-CoA hydratase